MANDATTAYYAKNRIDALAGLLVSATIGALLFIPALLLTYGGAPGPGFQLSPKQGIGTSSTFLRFIAADTLKQGVLLAFTVLTGIVVATTMNLKRSELFTIIGAYTAVLIVFIGSLGVQQVQVVTTASD